MLVIVRATFVAPSFSKDRVLQRPKSVPGMQDVVLQTRRPYEPYPVREGATGNLERLQTHQGIYNIFAQLGRRTRGSMSVYDTADARSGRHVNTKPSHKDDRKRTLAEFTTPT